MQQIDISKAKAQLPALLDAAINGAEIIITQDSQPLVKISRVDANGQAHDSGDSPEPVTAPTAPPITALQAQAEANNYLSDRMPDRFHASHPEFDPDAGFWRVPVVLSYPILGALGQVGEIIVGAQNEEVLSASTREEMMGVAQLLYEQNRDAIEAPLS